MLKTIIFLFQVGFTGDFVTDCPLNCVQNSDHNFNWFKYLLHQTSFS